MIVRKKILFITGWYPARNKPSHGIFFKRQAEAAAIFHDISVLHACPNPDLQTTYEFECYEEKNVKSLVVHYKKSDSLIGNILKPYRFLKAHLIGYRHFKKAGFIPDAFHLHVVWKACIAALILKFFTGKPLIISEQWSGYMPEDGNYKGFFMKFFTKLAFNNAEKIIALSENMKAGFQRHGLNGDFSFIPNVVDHQVFVPGDSSSFERKRFVHVSTLNDREKNISGILRAVAIASKQHEDFTLELIGDSKERNDFEKLAQSLGIFNKVVFFKGYKNQAEVAEHLKGAAGLILFSNYEGLPCVLIEAQSAGVPVITTKVGGIPEYFDDKTGILIESKDEEALAKAVSDICEGKVSFSSEELRAEAIKKFSYETVGRQLSEVYLSIK
jgi:glycosyltransferase involved in cell wall biosynthesis